MSRKKKRKNAVKTGKNVAAEAKQAVTLLPVENGNWIKLILESVFSVQMLAALNIVALIVLGYFLWVGPPYLSRYNIENQVVKSVSKLKSENFSDDQITFNVVISADVLKSQYQIFNNVQDGDIIMTFANGRLVVYRRSSNAIIYDGDNPDVANQKLTLATADKIKSKAIEKGILKLTQASSGVPQVLVLTDKQLSSLGPNKPEFYKSAQVGDVIAYFPTDSIVILYRVTTDEIIASSPYSVSISEINLIE